MLQVTIPGVELFDEETGMFITTQSHTLQLEHSLVSLSEWESKWCKPFLGFQRTQNEINDYVRCMTLTQNVEPTVYAHIPDNVLKQIQVYMDAPMTGTTFHRKSGGPRTNEFITSEIIYYWMVSLNIPFECQTWHLNRLLALIRVCNEKNSPPKKMSLREIHAHNKALNKKRRERLGTRG